MLGWEVVVRKDEFKVGDLGIYFSIGSVLEENDDTKVEDLEIKQDFHIFLTSELESARQAAEDQEDARCPLTRSVRTTRLGQGVQG